MKLRLILLYLFSSLFLWAQTPFTLTGIHTLSVLAEDKSVVKLSQSFLDNELEGMMKATLKKLHIHFEPYGETVLALLLRSNKVENTQLLTLQLNVVSQVVRSGEKEEVFGITYMMPDTIEIDLNDRNQVKEDIKESLEFLLSEFADQYIEDRED